MRMNPLPPPKPGTVAHDLIHGLTEYAETLERATTPKCERCEKPNDRPGYRLCKKCNDDDDAAIMAAYAACG